MHESSTAGGGDEKPREDGARADDARADGTPSDSTVQGDGTLSGAVADGTEAGTVAPAVPAAGAAGAGGSAEPDTPAEPRTRRAPERSQAEQDAIFAALVAQFDDPVDLTNPNWPEVENLRAQNELKGGYKDAPGSKADPDDLSDLAPQPRPRSGRPVLPASAAGPRDFELAEETDEGHYVPPEPPPLPTPDVTAKFAWLAVLGGPALLLIDAVVWREISGWPAWVGITAFLGGFVTLVARMKDRDEDEPEDPDHGAVV
ncbi:hypothetical protein ABT247_19700 [Kitasatospora sp. NPDC001539]|uniref:hypothetical protein n=1 Tax=Kitasatospora sp. NPDC001539 TaxID=3154384 RepID=UPI00331D7069